MSHQEMESMNELLSMTSFQLEEYVAQALENNPVHEADEHFTPRDEDIIPGTGRCLHMAEMWRQIPP